MLSLVRRLATLGALAALAAIVCLALFPPQTNALAEPVMGPDRAALWFLFGCALIAQIPPLFSWLSSSRDASTWALLGATFVLFHLADRAGPRDGWAVTLPFAPEEAVAISYAARAVVLGALLSVPLWLRRGGSERALLAALVIVGAFGTGSFFLLAQFYKVGATETFDPTPMATLAVQIVSYGALALCCRALTEGEPTRRLVLRALPFALLFVALRHQFAPLSAPKEDE